MAVKKESINLTYDALWFKIFMDSGDITFYNKEVFLTAGLQGNRDLIGQMLGNIGAYARTNDFDKDINVVVISNKMLSDLKDGMKSDFLCLLEDSINMNNTPYRKLKFTTEELLLDFLKTRATGSLRQNRKSLADDNGVELNISLKNAIDRDEVMLQLLQSYKDSTKVPQQQSLF